MSHIQHVLYIGKLISAAKLQAKNCGYTPVSLDELLHKQGYSEDFLLTCRKKDFFKALAKLQLSDVQGVINLFEHFIKIQHWALEYYGLAFCSEDAIRKANDKYLMRAAFSKHAPHITPKAYQISSAADLRKKALSLQFPIMLKPSGLTKSLLITRNEDLKELEKNYSFLTKKIGDFYKKEKAQKKPVIIIEEFLKGSFHSICAAVDSKGKVVALPPVDLIMAVEKGWADNHNYRRLLPSVLSSKERDLAIVMVQEAITSLGLTSTFTHTEFVMTAAGPKIIEVGARIGGYRTEMYERVYGYNLTEAQIQLGQQKSVRFPETSPQGYSAVYEVFPKKGGLLHSINFPKLLQESPLITSIRKNDFLKGRVGLAKDGYRAALTIKIFSKKKKPFYDLLAEIEKKVRVRTKTLSKKGRR